METLYLITSFTLNVQGIVQASLKEWTLLSWSLQSVFKFWNHCGVTMATHFILYNVDFDKSFWNTANFFFKFCDCQAWLRQSMLKGKIKYIMKSLWITKYCIWKMKVKLNVILSRYFTFKEKYKNFICYVIMYLFNMLKFNIIVFKVIDILHFQITEMKGFNMYFIYRIYEISY